MFLLVKSNYKIKIKESFKKSSSPIEDLTVTVWSLDCRRDVLIVSLCHYQNSPVKQLNT